MPSNAEPSDAELLKEIQEEAQQLQNEVTDDPDSYNETEQCVNDTIHVYDTQQPVGTGAQLTQFQDSVITTGSEVSIILMVVLIILFIIQSLRKSFKYFTLRSKIKQVHNPLAQSKPIAVENCNMFNKDFTQDAYAVYNTEFKERAIYEAKKRDNAPREELKVLIKQRALRCIERFNCIRRDAPGIRKNWNLDLVPKEVWEDFKAAQRSIDKEIVNIMDENKRCGYQWGEFKEDIFACSKVEFTKKRAVIAKIVETKKQLIMKQRQKKAMMIKQQQQMTTKTK